MDIIFQEHIQQVRTAIPFEVTSVKVHDGGDDFLVFEINSEWMFRFPRNDASRIAGKKEMQFLAKFKPLSPLPIPDYQYVGDGFAGYAKICGRQLSDEIFQEFSTDTYETIAEQLGSFLSVLHKFPLVEAEELGLMRGWDGTHHKNGRVFLNKVAPLLSSSARNKAIRCMEDLLADEFTGRVIHGDFYLPDHVFFDESKNQLGVIDFTDVNIYDPAHDLQSVVEIGGEAFFESVMKYYDNDQDNDLLKRSKLRLLARPLFVAGYFFANGLEDQYASRLARIEETFA
ncbi:MAG TPA: phosphotransferase [Anaerolineales bacterium]|nr:phosphotransferase [Anaerolineales bacterium]